MSKATSKTSCGTVLLMIFMGFCVLLATVAKGEKLPGRDEANGIDTAERPIQDEDNTSKKMISTVPQGDFVYMIYKPFETDKIVKIGCTEHPKTRLSTLQTGNEAKLDFASVIQVPVGRKFQAENVVKTYFKQLGLGTKSTLGGGNEWFYTGEIGGVNEAAGTMAQILQEKNLYISDVTSSFRIFRDLDKPIRETKRKN